MKSLLLDQATWDICLDANGNFAVATEPYAIAQDVACAARTFVGDCYYYPALGIPYFAQVLGKFPSLNYLRTQYVLAAQSVALVVKAKCVLTGIVNRQLGGQIQFTDSSGAVQVTALTPTIQIGNTNPTPSGGYLLTPDGTSVLLTPDGTSTLLPP